MKINFTEDALAYLAKKKKTIITIERVNGGSCYSPFPTGEVHLRRPRRPLSRYQVIEEAGITTYVSKDIKTLAGELNLSMSKMVFMEYIQVLGVDPEM